MKTDQVHFEGPVEKLLAVTNRSQKQRIDSTVLKGDTLVHSAATVYPCGSQTFMRRGPLPSLTREYLIHRDTWVMQYHGKATLSRPLLVAHKGGRGPHLRKPGSIQFIGHQNFWERTT